MPKSDTIECPEYNVLVEGMEVARAKVREVGKAAVGALFKAFFAQYPEVTAVGWTQYTPHFNDGDPCVFRVHEFYATTKTDMDFARVSRLYDDEEDKDLFQVAFGDHVMVIATPAGFHVNEYSHD